MIKKVLVFLLLFSLSWKIYAKKGPDVETKIAIEKNLEERLRRILVEITGTDKIIIVINVQLITEEEQKQEEEEIVLPGVPLQQKLGLGLASLDFGDTSTRLKKIVCQIIVDASLSDSMIKVIKDVAKGVLGLQDERGDVLEIKKMEFKKNTFSWSQILYPPHLWGIIFSIIGIILVVVVASFFFKIFPQTITVKTTTSAGTQTPTAELPIPETPATASPAIVKESGEEAPFSFLTEGNLEKLKIILPDLTPKQIAIILNYRPELSDLILPLLEEGKANEVLVELSNVRIFSSNEVKTFEESLKEQINFMVGGEEVIISILNSMPDDEIKKYLSRLKEKAPKTAEELNKKVLTFEKLLKLDEKMLFTILREVGFIDFANVLHSVDEAVREEFLNKFPEAIKTRLKEEIEFSPEISKYAVAQSKRKIAQVLKKKGILEG